MSVCTPWIEEDADLANCGCPDGPQLVVQQSIAAASDILYRLSGQQWPGECQETKRACRVNGSCGCGSFQLCSCVGADTIVLPRRRVISVDSVRIDGDPFTDYVFYQPNWVTRTDDTPWPCCQDLAVDSLNEGTWSITYTYGATPPAAAKNAARVLTSELVKACTRDTSCRIPMGAVSLTRKGVSYDMSQQEGKTGITEVDLWLSAVNPAGRRRRARLVSPDSVRWVTDTIVGS